MVEAHGAVVQFHSIPPHGSVSERSKEAVCKTAVKHYDGSNPSTPTINVQSGHENDQIIPFFRPVGKVRKGQTQFAILSV